MTDLSPVAVTRSLTGMCKFLRMQSRLTVNLAGARFQQARFMRSWQQRTGHTTQ